MYSIKGNLSSLSLVVTTLDSILDSIVQNPSTLPSTVGWTWDGRLVSVLALQTGKGVPTFSFFSDNPTSVRIDVDGLLREKAQREEEDEQRAEEEKHGLRRDVRGFAPRSYNENELERAAFTAKPVVKQAARKRKLEEMQANTATGTSVMLSEPKRKKPRPPPPTTGIPCCLCVSDADGLLSVHDPPLFGYPGFEPKVVDGKPQWQAHEECAKIVPETWVDEVDGQKFVFGVDAVPKDRWQLVSLTLLDAKSLA